MSPSIPPEYVAPVAADPAPAPWAAAAPPAASAPRPWPDEIYRGWSGL